LEESPLPAFGALTCFFAGFLFVMVGVRLKKGSRKREHYMGTFLLSPAMDSRLSALARGLLYPAA